VLPLQDEFLQAKLCPNLDPATLATGSEGLLCLRIDVAFSSRIATSNSRRASSLDLATVVMEHLAFDRV
jgi:hypothetical protein